MLTGDYSTCARKTGPLNTSAGIPLSSEGILTANEGMFLGLAATNMSYTHVHEASTVTTHQRKGHRQEVQC